MATDIQRLVPYGCDCPTCQQQPDGPTAEEHRDINHLVAASDERSRRLLVGFLARQRGRGGIALLARITGLSPHTIRKGQRELRQPDSAPPGRVRRPGGGRQRVEKKSPRW
jgi:hypothetical protein